MRTASETRGNGHGTRAFRILIAAVLVMSALAIGGGISRNAAAATSWSTAAGWMGNQAIYMNPNILSGADSKGFGSYVLPEFAPAKSTDHSGLSDTAVAVTGEHSTDVGGNVEFYEFYDGTGGYLDVHIPIALAGEWSNSTGPSVECQYLSLTDNYLPHTTMQILGNDNNGVNVTGTQPLSPGTAVQNAEYDLELDAFAAIPIVGTPVALYQEYKSYEGVAKVVGSPYIPYAAGAGAKVIQSYDVVNGTSDTQGVTVSSNVFGPQIYVDVHINETDFTTGSPAQTFNVQGQNFLSSLGSGCTAGESSGAVANLGIFAYPAIEVEGTVSLGSRTLANQALPLSDGGSNVYTFSTNGQGSYRFFAKPATTYTLPTTFENQQNSTVFATGTDPTGPPQYEDLHVPPFTATPSAYPNPTQVGNNTNFQTALSGAFVFPVSYSWNFGDGTWANGTVSPSHIYVQSGDMTVTLRASDPGNPKQWSSRTLSLSVTNPCSGIKACVSPASQTVYYNKGGSCNIPTASFAGYAASTDQPPFTYGWAFGDGGTGSGQSISHTYPLVTTTWPVTLTVTNRTGYKTTATATVTVKYLMACQPP